MVSTSWGVEVGWWTSYVCILYMVNKKKYIRKEEKSRRDDVAP